MAKFHQFHLLKFELYSIDGGHELLHAGIGKGNIHVHALYVHPWYVPILMLVLLGYQGVDVKHYVEYVWHARCMVLNYMMWV